MSNKLFISDTISTEMIQKIVRHSLHEYDDVSCYLFGSYAKGTPTTVSDIDLLLLFERAKRGYSFIEKIMEELRGIFADHQKYCQPIYGDIYQINKDSHILFRQYINYGKRLYGPDVKSFMNNESEGELRSLEYERYWTPMYQWNMTLLDSTVNDDRIFESSINWRYLYRALYQYAKAQLTLLDQHHSLNEFTLEYIYGNLMQVSLSAKQFETLQFIQEHNDAFLSGKDFNEGKSFREHFQIAKRMIK